MPRSRFDGRNFPCRFSDQGKKDLCPMKPLRTGMAQRPLSSSDPHVLVKWDGQKSTQTYHKDFIDIDER